MTWTSSSTRAIIKVDDRPTWVCVNDIVALGMMDTPLGETFIHLTGNHTVYTDTLVEEIMEMIKKANSP